MFRASLSLFFLLAGMMSGQTTLWTGQSLVSGNPSRGQEKQTPPATNPASIQATAGGAGFRLSLDQAIALALANSPAIKAARTQIQQSQAQEITAGLRPNPTLAFDSQFIPLFNPSQFSADTLNTLQQFDIGVGYLFERGKKRQRRLEAARDQTTVTSSQVTDTERALIFNVGQQFVNALLANSTLQFAQEALKSFQQTVNISAERYRAGDISEGDFLKIKLQMLQFQTDVTSAQVARVQALGSLRQLVGYGSVPRDFDVAGDLDYQPLTASEEDLRALAIRTRPDLRAAQLAVKAAKSQIALAKADAKQDLNASFNYSHVAGASSGSFFFSIPLPFFNRNQGEIARTQFVLTQSDLTAKATEETALTDVSNAYEATNTSQEVVKLYISGYLKQSQDSREISEYAYKAGAATLLDFLDAERSYRATQLAYRQALAAYMLSLEQLRQAVGTRSLL
ncbi:MAG TPA: TolC family protein [Candidatus Angelobacter sp.]|nr:TolC family protein [Candidatus Angelobacter sp.]